MSNPPQLVTVDHRDGSRTNADLVVPDAPVGVVVFAHGSGSSRLSPRNKMVAAALNEQRLATFLLDLLTPDEDAAEQRGAMRRFEVNFLADRLASAVTRVRADAVIGALPVGYFGASTGAAAALIAAAQHPDGIAAIVSRGGRPDLAGPHLRDVRAPTLLLVGGNDTVVIGMNQDAATELTAAPTELVIIPGATHLFEEAGALEEVAHRAGDWFVTHMRAAWSER